MTCSAACLCFARRSAVCLVVALLPSVAMNRAAQAQEEATTISLGDFTITAPKQWERQQPRSRIIAYEFAVPAVEGDEDGGRMTVMAAGGSVVANIERWYGQFTQPDGGSTKETAKVEEKEIAGQEVHLVDLAGTFSDRRGPAFPAVERENYRMLAAIIVTKQGQFFIKFYGPRKTVSENKDRFAKMIDSLAAK
ncbi:MAG: hypothetical protein KDA63_14235 [Planctomycetales bacterium]|nr:hypothetical protein [Planctomycetales bacterium]